MKFKAGDHIIVIESDIKGKVVGITYNSINQCDEYVVKWNNHPYQHTYPVDECDPIWKHDEAAIITAHQWKCLGKPWRYSPPLDHIDLIISIGDEGVNTVSNCHHNWKIYDSGFSRFEYCSECNKEKT